MNNTTDTQNMHDLEVYKDLGFILTTVLFSVGFSHFDLEVLDNYNVVLTTLSRVLSVCIFGLFLFINWPRIMSRIKQVFKK